MLVVVFNDFLQKHTGLRQVGLGGTHGDPQLVGDFLVGKPIQYIHVEYRAVRRRQLLDLFHQFLIEEHLVRRLALVFVHPDAFRDVADLGEKIIFSEQVNGRVDHDHAHPAHEDHLQVIRVAVFEAGKIAEDFDKPVIHYVHGLVVTIDVPEYGLEAVSIILLIEAFLVPLVVVDAPRYDILQQFQSGLINGEYANPGERLPAPISRVKVQLVS